MQDTLVKSTSKGVYCIQVRKRETPLTIRSNFDSGNTAKVELGLNNSIIVTPANDCANSSYESHAKGWFYFGVMGHVAGSRYKFVIKSINQLGGQTKFSDYFKPVYRYGHDGNWDRIQQAITFNKEHDTELHFEFVFDKNSQVFIAYSFPFSYSDCQNMIVQLKNQAKLHKGIYFHDDIVIKSVEGRSIHLLTISSNDNKLTCRQSPINDNMFTSSNNRAYKFGESKKVVIISARVHPGETPSSHTVHGILKFLVSKDARAELLRKNFLFKIMPMLNPDGVYCGHYRMDTLNQNLNRFYLDPDFLTQPSTFALKKLGSYFRLQGRLCFFMDLHAHPQKKGNFIYGNSIDNPAEQIQTQLYPKILSFNSVQFDYENSCFSKNHMAYKDRNEDHSKQGCSRVVFHRELGIVYSYTMECGYTQSNFLNQLNPISNPHRKVDKLSLIHHELDNIKSAYYDKTKKNYFTVRSYQNLGKNIVISILDLFNLNQYSRLPNGTLKTLEQIRNFICEANSKQNKDFKPYIRRNQHEKINGEKLQQHDRLSDKLIVNETCKIGRSLPKTVIRLFQKKVISQKLILIQKEKCRRKTLRKIRKIQ